MSESLKSLISAGTKLWLDSIDPDLVQENFAMGATGATSNPIIVSDLLKSGRFDKEIKQLAAEGLSAEAVAWQMTDNLVRRAQEVFLPIFESTKGDDGYVSFELDPLLEDTDCSLSTDERSRRYVEQAKQYTQGLPNRMIKVPATPAGIGALPQLAAAGIPLNVTLIFSRRQYLAAREGVLAGMAELTEEQRQRFKSVFSIFVSRLDVYAGQHLPQLNAAKGWLGIVNAKRIWSENREFWASQNLPLAQELIFASTGTKDPADEPWKYVAAFAGSDIETNPPATNQAVAVSGKVFGAGIHEMPSQAVLEELDQHLDQQHMEETLMREGLEKFAAPQKALLKTVASMIV